MIFFIYFSLKFIRLITHIEKKIHAKLIIIFYILIFIYIYLFYEMNLFFKLGK
jgi:hypothetical protein